jgi:hypothetical protein
MATWLSGWDYTSSVKNCASTTTVTDKLMEKVVGKPYRGKPDLRFDVAGAGNVTMVEM